MSDNVFTLLAEKDRKSTKSDKSSDTPKDAIIIPKEEVLKVSNNSTEGEESTWTVQSTKPRRLVPQFSLSRQDLGSDSSRSKPVVAETQKKKGIF